MDKEVVLPIALERAWDLVSDTDRLNQMIGLPPVVYGTPKEKTFYREASARVGFLTIRWKEYPFEWLYRRRYSVRREFLAGPFKTFCGGSELEAISPTQTKVKIFAEFTPRNFAGRLMIPLVARRSLSQIIAYCKKSLQSETQHDVQSDFPALPKPPQVNIARLDKMLETVRKKIPTSPGLEKLRDHIITKIDRDVLRIQPYAVADAWGEKRLDVLKIFLHATVAGIFYLDWELMCPNCRVPKAEHRTFQEINNSAHCDMCGLNFEVDMDQFIELRFSVNPEIRSAKSESYCLGGPSNTRHVWVQQVLLPGEERSFQLHLGSELFRLRTLRANQTMLLKPQSAGDAKVIRGIFSDEGWLEKEMVFKPGLNEMVVKNNSTNTIVFVVEKVKWDEKAATAAEVTALQDFRDLFSSEVLAEGKEIGIRNLCVLFTDLKSSTKMYETIGDAAAFGRVHRHFDFLTNIVRKNRGALVKTIGDAVMAVFPTTVDAITTAVEIQKNVGQFNRDFSFDPPIVIRVGFHHGPAIAVNANGYLDYFGRTVNIAARIQNESQGDDIILTEEVFHEPEIQAQLTQFPLEQTFYGATLKGIDGSFRLCRLRFKNEKQHHTSSPDHVV